MSLAAPATKASRCISSGCLRCLVSNRLCLVYRFVAGRGRRSRSKNALHWRHRVILCGVLKSYSTWLIMVGILVGLSFRVFGAVDLHLAIEKSCDQHVEVCCNDHSDVPAPHDHSHEKGNDCPLEHHHHHGNCSHVLPLIVDQTFQCRVEIPDSSLLGVRHEGEVPPDGPYLSSEKPPLI